MSADADEDADLEDGCPECSSVQIRTQPGSSRLMCIRCRATFVEPAQVSSPSGGRESHHGDHYTALEDADPEDLGLEPLRDGDGGAA